MPKRAINTRRTARAAAALLGAALLGGCTIDDRFTFDDPVAEVTLEQLEALPAPGGGSCIRGTTVYWGQARNTGGVFLHDVRAFVDVLDAGGGLLGRFGGGVFNGDSGTDDAGNISPSSTLDLDQGGSFTICTTVPFGAAASANVRFQFVILELEE